MDKLIAKTILVAEDEAFVRRVIVTALSGAGAHVIDCADGQAALDILRARRVDVALLDLVMPHVNGMCVLQAIRAGGTLQDFDTPAMLLTATRDEACVTYAAELSCNGFLLKPLKRAELVSRLEKIIAQRMELPYTPHHYRAIELGPPDQPPTLPAARGLKVAQLRVGMVFSAPVSSRDLMIVPAGTKVTAELLALLEKLDKTAPIDPMFATLSETVA